jgi:hypothetical protein
MNVENILIIAVCIILISVVGYFLWNKISNQNKIIEQLSKRIEDIELMFTNPPSQDELNSVFGYEKHQISNKHRFQKIDHEQEEEKECENGLCDLSPMVVDSFSKED